MKTLYNSLVNILFFDRGYLISAKKDKNWRAEKLVESGLIKLVKEEEGELFKITGQITRHYQPTKKGKKLVREIYAIFEKYLK